jgi:hypothetical protein
MKDCVSEILRLIANQQHSYMKWGQCTVIGAETNRALVDYLLSINTHNRNPKAAQIGILRAEQECGNWKHTAQGIGVDSSGILSDGQNRLLANKDAGYPSIPILIVCGLAPEAQSVVDQHARRTMADTMTLLMNVTVTTRIVASMNILIACDGLRNRGVPFSYCPARASARMLADAMSEWNDFLDIAGSPVASASVSGTICSYGKHFSGDVARSFLADLKAMVGLQKDSPVLRLAATIKQTKTVDGQSRLYLIGATAAAISAYGRGDSLKMIRPAKSW